MQTAGKEGPVGGFFGVCREGIVSDPDVTTPGGDGDLVAGKDVDAADLNSLTFRQWNIGDGVVVGLSGLCSQAGGEYEQSGGA